ncbi:AAA family ATPase [Rhodohalobacter sp. 8-1]|uniref:AAA family ATPase n=1 Tax=Rhodohalobacter sp. 8-1 TaxID=3131972 RepID=UPI0030ED1504
MDFFIERDQQLRQKVPNKFFRHLYYSIDFTKRLTIIYGAPGTGKSTLLLQLADYHDDLPPEESLYLSGETLWFHTKSLYEIAELFYLNGGRHLLIDDLHSYPDRAQSITQIISDLPDLRLISTSAAPLTFLNPLAGQVSSHHLPPLSFREYLQFRESIRIDQKKLGEIVSFHKEFSEGISGLFQPIPPFRRYLAGGTLFSPKNKPGYYPGTLFGEQRMNTFLESVLPALEGVDYRSVTKIKRLLALIIHQGPFKPNISDMARYLSVSRDSIYSWLSLLEHTGIIHRIWLNRTGTTRHRKPDLIAPGDPSFLQFAGNQPRPDAVRKTFLISQLQNAGFNCSIHKSGAVYLNGMTITTGDRDEPLPDVSDGSHPIVAADNLEVGSENRIPLWMFGLLY